MSQVNAHTENIQMPQGLQDQQDLQDVDAELRKTLQKLIQQGQISPIPDAKSDTPTSTNVELPTLNVPGALASGGSLALDVLLDAIGNEVRQSETKAGISSIKANAQTRELANKEKIEKIQEQIEKLEKAGFWSKLTKAFAWIGAIFAVAVSAVLVATGAGAAAGVGLALACVALVNQVGDTIGEAVDGKGYGLTSLAARAFGEKAEAKVKMALDIILVAATILTSFGAGAASKIGEAGKLATTMQKIAQIGETTTGIAQAGTNVATSVYTYQASNAQADQKRLQAILDQIMMMNDVINKHLKNVIEESQNLTEKVHDIVQENVQAQTAILTQNPTMA